MKTTLDHAKAAAFAGQALGIVNGGFLSLMMSIGHRTALFDTLATLPASTSDEIASAAGLHERYVREWLGAMVTGRVVEYEPETRRYRLPPEHAAALTRAAGPDNLAELAQLVAILGDVETPIVEVFRRGGGVGYDAFERFHDWMAEASRTTLEAALLSRVLPQVPGLVERLDAVRGCSSWNGRPCSGIGCAAKPCSRGGRQSCNHSACGRPCCRRAPSRTAGGTTSWAASRLAIATPPRRHRAVLRP